MAIVRPILIASSVLLAASSGFGQSNAQPKTGTRENGHVAFMASTDNRITGLKTTLRVPPKPERAGTVFLWPGLQPHSQAENFWPIDNGVLQPVLTWGPSCAPREQPKAYSTWWISAQYVNTVGRYRGYMGCQGGPIMPVNPGDMLSIEMSLSGTKWVQRIRNTRRQKSVAFTIDLIGQAQVFAYFDIELGRDGGPHVADVVFRDTTIAFARADAQNCRVLEYGPRDLVTPAVSRKGGKECYIRKIVLKSKFPPTVSDPSCRFVRGARSISAKDPATITFKNERGLPIRVCWIDHKGAHRLCQRIANGDTVQQSTFLTHPWIVTDLNRTCIGLYRPSKPSSAHVIR